MAEGQSLYLDNKQQVGRVHSLLEKKLIACQAHIKGSLTICLEKVPKTYDYRLSFFITGQKKPVYYDLPNGRLSDNIVYLPQENIQLNAHDDGVEMLVSSNNSNGHILIQENGDLFVSGQFSHLNLSISNENREVVVADYCEVPVCYINGQFIIKPTGEFVGQWLQVHEKQNKMINQGKLNCLTIAAEVLENAGLMMANQQTEGQSNTRNNVFIGHFECFINHKEGACLFDNMNIRAQNFDNAGVIIGQKHMRLSASVQAINTGTLWSAKHFHFYKMGCFENFYVCGAKERLYFSGKKVINSHRLIYTVLQVSKPKEGEEKLDFRNSGVFSD